MGWLWLFFFFSVGGGVTRSKASTIHLKKGHIFLIYLACRIRNRNGTYGNAQCLIDALKFPKNSWHGVAGHEMKDFALAIADVYSSCTPNKLVWQQMVHTGVACMAVLHHAIHQGTKEFQITPLSPLSVSIFVCVYLWGLTRFQCMCWFVSSMVLNIQLSKTS